MLIHKKRKKNLSSHGLRPFSFSFFVFRYLFFHFNLFPKIARGLVCLDRNLQKIVSKFFFFFHERAISRQSVGTIVFLDHFFLSFIYVSVLFRLAKSAPTRIVHELRIFPELQKCARNFRLKNIIIFRNPREGKLGLLKKKEKKKIKIQFALFVYSLSFYLSLSLPFSPYTLALAKMRK